MGKRPTKAEEEGSPRKKNARLALERAEGTSAKNPNHVITDETFKLLSESITSKNAGTCFDCQRDNSRPGRSDILICVKCYRHLCCGVGARTTGYPSGHSRAHALKEKHWFAALYCEIEERAYCFKCNFEVKFGPATPPSVGAMEKRPPKGEAEGSPRKKNPRLALERAEATSAKNPNHVITDEAFKWLSESITSKVAGTCFDCQRDNSRPGRSDILICVKCYRHLCCGVGARTTGYSSGHSRAHALKEKHWFAALYCETEKKGYCFKCNVEVKFGPATPPSVDSSEMQHIFQIKDVVQSPLQIQVDKSVDVLPHDVCDVKFGPVKEITTDSISIEDFLLLLSEDRIYWCCPICAKDDQEPSASQSKNGELMLGSSNEDITVILDQTEHADKIASHSKEPKCHGAILPAEKRTDLLITKLSADLGKELLMYLKTEGVTPSQLKVGKSEQKDNVGDGIKINPFTTLPPVLALQLKKGIPFGKRSVHVRSMEYLDVERLTDNSSVGRGSTLYRLAGVVGHIGNESLKAGHYVAYLRARRRLGNQQPQSSCSSWFCADDNVSKQVTLEQVLKCKTCRMSDWHQNCGCSEVKQMPREDSVTGDTELMPFLPPSVVYDIWRHLCNDSDRVRMRLVSRLWYEHLPRIMPRRPWVIGSEMENGLCHYVYQKSLGLMKFKCKIPTGSFLGSCWDFLMIESELGYSIWNPSDSMILKLPLKTCDKIVMFTASDAYAFTLSKMGQFQFCYGRPVDESSWKQIICRDKTIRDIGKSKNQFYAVNTFMKIYRLDRASNKMEVVGPQQSSSELFSLIGGSPDRIFIADLNGDLIVIALGRNLEFVHLLKAVWTSDQIMNLVTVTELGSWSLFLGRNEAIALNSKDFPGIQANALYLVLESLVDVEGPTTVLVYDLATRSTVDVGYGSCGMGEPIFYHPSFCCSSDFSWFSQSQTQDSL